jgi:hypothetical protein
MNRPRGARTAITVAAVAVDRATGLATGSAYSSAGSLQNVPVAVTALTAGVLERGQARELGGPQSALFGKNAIAGAVNITTAERTGVRAG